MVSRKTSVFCFTILLDIDLQWNWPVLVLVDIKYNVCAIHANKNQFRFRSISVLKRKKKKEKNPDVVYNSDPVHQNPSATWLPRAPYSTQACVCLLTRLLNKSFLCLQRVYSNCNTVSNCRYYNPSSYFKRQYSHMQLLTSREKHVLMMGKLQ